MVGGELRVAARLGLSSGLREAIGQTHQDVLVAHLAVPFQEYSAIFIIGQRCGLHTPTPDDTM